MQSLRQKIDSHNVVGRSKGVNQVSSCADTGSQSLAAATSERDFREQRYLGRKRRAYDLSLVWTIGLINSASLVRNVPHQRAPAL